MVILYPLLAQLIMIVYLYLGVTVIKKCAPSKETRLVFALCMFMGFWAFFDIFYYSSYWPYQFFGFGFYNFVEHARLPGVYAYGPIMLHIVLCKAQPFELAKYGWLNYAIYIPALALFAADIFLGGLHTAGIRLSVFIQALYYSSYALACIFLVLAWGRRTALEREKKQAGYIFWCGVATLLIILVYVTGFVSLLGNDLPTFSEAILLILVFGIWYSIIKYNFISITELVKAEEIIEQVDDLIVLVDWSKNIVKVNESLTKTLGFSKEEIIGMPFAGLIKGGFDVPGFLTGSSDDDVLEWDMVPAEGKEIPAAVRLRKIKDPAGETAGMLAICKDMRNVRELQEEVLQRMKKEIQLKYLGMHDILTGLHNRTFFEHEVQRLEQSARKSIGMIICDVDGLKIINDTLGHAKGDDLLKRTTMLLRETKNEKVILARIGGDEFALLMPDCTLAQLKSEEQRIRETVTAKNSLNKGIPLSISTGSAFTADRGKSIYSLYKEADNSMYMEKLKHRGSVRNLTIQALVDMMKVKDFTDRSHIDRAWELAFKFGEKAGLGEGRLNMLNLLVQFHDIGMVGIPDNILFKTSALNTEEMEEMKRHSEIGYKIAAAAPDIMPAADLILKHHERWDGSGYILGIKGEQIPLECRLLSIIDAFEAITNDRPYRKAMDVDYALKEIAQNAGTQFDPNLAYLFIEMLTKDRLILGEYR